MSSHSDEASCTEERFSVISTGHSQEVQSGQPASVAIDPTQSVSTDKPSCRLNAPRSKQDAQVDLLAFLRKSEDALHAINDHGSQVRDDVQKIVDCMRDAGEEPDKDLESEMVTSSFALKEAIQAINAVAAELQAQGDKLDSSRKEQSHE